MNEGMIKGGIEECDMTWLDKMEGAAQETVIEGGMTECGYWRRAEKGDENLALSASSSVEETDGGSFISNKLLH